HAVASNLFKLMAYKDEYEVARLYTQGDFKRRLHDSFEGATRLRFHFAPPLVAGRDAQGHLRKRSYGPWMWHVLAVLARCRRLRGTWLDPFGHTAERREERRLVADYRAAIEQVLARWGGV